MVLHKVLFLKQLVSTCMVQFAFCTLIPAVVKPARQFSHAMQISGHYHYLSLQKFIVFTVYEHEKFA